MSLYAKYVIKESKPLRLVLFIFAIIGITFSIQFYINYHSLYTHLQLISKLEQLQQALGRQLGLKTLHNKRLRESNAELNSIIIERQQYLSIQQAMDKELQVKLSELQSELIGLNKELVFYQNVTHGNSSTKLKVYTLQLQADNQIADGYHYRIVVTQGKKISKAITGKISIIINVKRHSKNKSVIVREHLLNLRYVQVVEGKLKISENIAPENIKIIIKLRNIPSISYTFGWHIEGNY